jgi:hypothetical protein
MLAKVTFGTESLSEAGIGLGTLRVCSNGDPKLALILMNNIVSQIGSRIMWSIGACCVSLLGWEVSVNRHSHPCTKYTGRNMLNELKLSNFLGYSHRRCCYPKTPSVGNREDGANQFVSGRACVNQPCKFG